VTFTLPEGLRKVARSNQKIVYSILMRTAWAAIEKLARHHKWIGGLPGAVSVLQTWTRDMRYHPHVHMIITGGGLSKDANQWMPARKAYLLPAKAVAKVFRAKFANQLRKAGLYNLVASSIWKNDWVVDVRPVASGHAAFRYLAPYLFRVAISNNRILALQQNQVTFRYKDSKTGKNRTVSLSAEHFIHRFLQHVLPSRFRKVRYHGIFSPYKKSLLENAKNILTPNPQISPTLQPLAKNPLKCPYCQSLLVLVEILQPQKSHEPFIRSP